MADLPETESFSPAGDVLRWLLESIRRPVPEEEILTHFVRRLLVDTPHAGRVCVWAVTNADAPSAPRLELVASARPPGAVVHEEWKLDGDPIESLPLSEPLVGQAVARGETHWARDEVAWPTYPGWAKQDGVFSFYAAPILPDPDDATQTFGALAVFHRYRFLDPQVHERTIRRVRLQADLLGTAILRARESTRERDRGSRRIGEVLSARRARHAASGHGAILGDSPAARRIREQVALGARTGAPVLILGEPGCGRTLAAWRVVAESDRPDQPWAEVDAAAVPIDDAAREIAEEFEIARGGALLVRHVHRLPFKAQLALLETIERGDEGPDPARVIATGATDLRTAVETGRFDPDLWNRLAVVVIDVAPLRMRRSDIPELANRFALEAARRFGRGPRLPTPQQLRALAAHPWPGNARELAATVERAVLTVRGPRLDFGSVFAEAAPETIRATAPDGAPPIHTENEMRALARENTLAALRRAGWRVSGPDGAAALLGIKPTTLAARMKAMDIERPRWDEIE